MSAPLKVRDPGEPATQGDLLNLEHALKEHVNECVDGACASLRKGLQAWTKNELELLEARINLRFDSQDERLATIESLLREKL